MAALDADQMRELLSDLLARLATEGIRGGVRVVGGSAIALMNPARRATHDIDAVLTPAEPILAAARDMASERGLPDDWLNDAVKAYVPPVGGDDWVEILWEGDISVYVGSLRMLLAMKLYANRGRRDTEDIEFLLGACDVTSLEQAQEIFEEYHAQEVISDSAALRVQAWLDDRPHTDR